MENKNCQNCKIEFSFSQEDLAFLKKIGVPSSDFCSDCRMTGLLSYANMRSLYKRVCGLCSKPIVTMYHTDDVGQVYCNDCWQSDSWDPFSYGQSVDDSKSFFEQWHSLYQQVPRQPLRRVQMVESDYTNFSVQGNRCYFGYSVLRGEDLRYVENIDDSKNSMDCIFVKGVEWCYENLDSSKNYNCSYLAESRDCIDSQFLFDCANCQNCFMSANLRNGQYVFRGQQLSKEDYKTQIEAEGLDRYKNTEKLKQEFKNLKENSIHRFADITNSMNATGNHIGNSKNIKKAFYITDGEEITEAIRVPTGKEIRNCLNITQSELIYLCIACSVGCNTNFASMYCNGSKNVEYSILCVNCDYTFGCISLRNKKYCIFNVQYEKDEYFKIIEGIKYRMIENPFMDIQGRAYSYGAFFPPQFSPFGYNETMAHDYFRKTRQEVLDQGYNWKEQGRRNYIVTHTAQDLPDSIFDVDEEIVNAVIECAHKGECNDQCTNAFRILPEDLRFYKKMKVSLPRLCPNCRHYERLLQRPPARLWDRGCACSESGHDHTGDCGKHFETSYSPDRPEKVYCESCYQKSVL